MKLFDGESVLMLKVSRKEALQLIQSLSTQLVEDDPNVGRMETFLDEPQRRDFSIAVLSNP